MVLRPQSWLARVSSSRARQQAAHPLYSPMATERLHTPAFIAIGQISLSYQLLSWFLCPQRWSMGLCSSCKTEVFAAASGSWPERLLLYKLNSYTVASSQPDSATAIGLACFAVALRLIRHDLLHWIITDSFTADFETCKTWWWQYHSICCLIQIPYFS